MLFADYSVLSEPPGDDAPHLEGIHVVHIGTMMLEKREPEHKVGHYLAVAERLARDGIHFHLYGGAKVPGAFEDLYADYLDLERRTGFVHVHREIPLPQLLRELRGYTFGIHIAGSLLHFRNSHSDSLPPRHEYCTASRVYDLVIAGLPVILHEGRFLFWLTQRWGQALLVDEGFLREPGRWLRERLPGEEEAKRLRESWRVIDCAKHAPRLVRFYETLQPVPSAGVRRC